MVRCRGIVKIYAASSGEVFALRGVDADLEAGTVTAIVGPSGSGKSSLLRILTALDRPTAGSVSLGGRDLGPLSDRGLRHVRRTLVGIVLQRPSHNLFPGLTAREHVVHAARQRGRRAAPVDDLLERVGLADRRAHRPAELSGGEQQRLAVAAAAAGRAAVLVADEPTAELDQASGARVVTLLRSLATDGITVAVTTHDERVTAAADRVLELRHGALSAEATGGRSLAIIDESGRVQLPSAALSRFPARRALIELDGDGVRLGPP